MIDDSYKRCAVLWLGTAPPYCVTSLRRFIALLVDPLEAVGLAEAVAAGIDPHRVRTRPGRPGVVSLAL
jgi:hypothetical protein